MILNIYLGLMVIAFGGVLVPGRQRMTGIMLLLSCCLFFLYHLNLPINGQVVSWRYDWLPSAGLHSSLNLHFDSALRKLLLPIVLSISGLIYLTVFSSVEKQGRSFSAQLILSIGAFVILASAEGFIQLIAGSCLYTIFGFYLIDRMEIKKKYLFYNFVAEMALFTACAIIYGSLGKIALSDCVVSYAHIGEHKDFVALLLLINIFAKAGIFPFQNTLTEAPELPFNRLIALTLLMTPISAFIILFKVYPMIAAAPSVNINVVWGVTLVSGLWGFFGAILMDNLKSKTIYLNQMFGAAIIMSMCTTPQFTSGLHLFALVPPMLLLNVFIMMAFEAASNEVLISQMGGFIKKLKISFGVTLAGIFLLLEQLALMPVGQFGLLCFVGILISMAHILYGIYFGKTKAGEHVWALLKNPSFFYMLPLALIIGWWAYTSWTMKLLSLEMLSGQIFCLGGLGFLIILILHPLNFVEKMANNEKIQETDWTDKFYQVLILMPIRLLGRILWITIDFLFIERTVISSLSQSTGLLVRSLHRLQNAVWLNYIMMFALGVGIFIVFAGRYYYE